MQFGDLSFKFLKNIQVSIKCLGHGASVGSLCAVGVQSWALSSAVYQLCGSGQVMAFGGLNFLSCKWKLQLPYVYRHAQCLGTLLILSPCRGFWQTFKYESNTGCFFLSLARILGLRPVFLDYFLQAVSERSSGMKWSTNSWFWVLCLPNKLWGLYLETQFVGGIFHLWFSHGWQWRGCVDHLATLLYALWVFVPWPWKGSMNTRLCGCCFEHRDWVVSLWVLFKADAFLWSSPLLAGFYVYAFDFKGLHRFSTLLLATAEKFYLDIIRAS